jgi:copper(I)-binding protein
MNLFMRALCLGMLCGSLSGVQAQNIAVSDAWVRSTVPGQKATGAFMKITAPQTARLVSASSPVAGVVEIHEMKMERDVMKMSALSQGLVLPAGQTIELKPGGYHVMLMDLKSALSPNTQVAVKLTFQDARGQQTTQELSVPVMAQPAHGGHRH